jgi:hypothetical protein
MKDCRNKNTLSYQYDEVRKMFANPIKMNSQRITDISIKRCLLNI